MVLTKKYTEQYPLLIATDGYNSAWYSQTNMATALLFIAINLSLGSSGQEVIALQKILNQDPATQIALTGPGSPGYETSYFGSLTQRAVIRFQEKYSSEILIPAGLSSGNGYVGLYTRTKLNALSSIAKAPTISVALTPQPVPTNPNEENLDKFYQAIDKVAAKKGLSATKVATIKSEVKRALATTTNLREAFFKTIDADMRQARWDNSPMGRVMAALERIFMPAHALAQVDPAALDATFQAAAQAEADAIDAVTGVPFGGALFFQFYCWNSNTWMLTIEPLPPSYVMLLSYVPGTQAFREFNIPFTHELLGKYEPVGVCVFGCPYCVTIPTEGTIMPIVGSSAI